MIPFVANTLNNKFCMLDLPSLENCSNYMYILHHFKSAHESKLLSIFSFNMIKYAPFLEDVNFYDLSQAWTIAMVQKPI